MERDPRLRPAEDQERRDPEVPRRDDRAGPRPPTCCRSRCSALPAACLGVALRRPAMRLIPASLTASFGGVALRAHRVGDRCRASPSGCWCRCCSRWCRSSKFAASSRCCCCAAASRGTARHGGRRAAARALSRIDWVQAGGGCRDRGLVAVAVLAGRFAARRADRLGRLCRGRPRALRRRRGCSSAPRGRSRERRWFPLRHAVLEPGAAGQPDARHPACRSASAVSSSSACGRSSRT